MKKSSIGSITKIIVDIFFYLGIICVIGIPFLGKALTMQYNYNYGNYKFITVVLFLSGLCTVYILYNLKRMFKTLISGNPFVSDNIKCFHRIAAACIIIALIYILKCIVMFSLATVVIICVFATAALFCLTLKDIFKQAIAYKEENDWTV